MPGKNNALISAFNLPMLALTLAVALFMLHGSYIANGYLIDGQGYVLGRDFLNFWYYGLAAWNGEVMRYYDIPQYNLVLDALIPGYDYPDQSFSYPPHFMLLAAPFGLVGYNWALVLFHGSGIYLFWRVVAAPLDDRAARIALLVMPTFIVFFLCGQLSAFLAVILVAIYRNLDTRHWLAGLLIALMTVKPQLGILVPLFLLLTRRWQVFGFATLFSLLFVGASLLVHGIEPWRHYLTDGIAHQSSLMVFSNVVVIGLMPTIFVNLVMTGLGETLAMTIHGAVALAVTAMMVVTILGTRDRFLQFAALVAATFSVTPYLMAYDTLILGWVVVMFAIHHGTNAWQAMTYRLVLILPVLGVTLALVGIPGAPLVLLGLNLWVWMAAREGQTITSRSAVVPQ
ncbi:MAG: glycosyltransferase family 87 protein [Rhizobiaceae bacterium]